MILLIVQNFAAGICLLDRILWRHIIVICDAIVVIVVVGGGQIVVGAGAVVIVVRAAVDQFLIWILGADVLTETGTAL